jgi:hypothetical protein
MVELKKSVVQKQIYLSSRAESGIVRRSYMVELKK